MSWLVSFKKDGRAKLARHGSGDPCVFSNREKAKQYIRNHLKHEYLVTDIKIVSTKEVVI